MTWTALPPLLLADLDLPRTELDAARLDGELVRVGDGFVPVGAPVDARHRAAALAADVPAGATLVGRSAAWVHGAAGRCPIPVEVGSPGPSSRWVRPYRTVRAMRIRSEHREEYGIRDRRIAVLSPVATVIDLLRIPSMPGDVSLLGSLIRRRGIQFVDVLACLDEWTHLPGKRELRARLDGVYALSRR
jgi:hypothetical protein